MASKFKQGQNGLLIDPSNERVVGSIDRNGNELLFPYILAQSAVPIILLPAGSWTSTTGDMTVGTPLHYQPLGVVWVYLFASGIARAGLHQATFTSVDTLQLVGKPATVVGPYTSATSQAALMSANVPGGSMGANGAIRASMLTTRNAAGTSVVNVGFNFGGTDPASYGSQATTSLQGGSTKIIRNRGVENQQITTFYSAEGTTSGTPGYARFIDTRTDKLWQILGALITVTDYLIIEGYTIEVLPGV